MAEQTGSPTPKYVKLNADFNASTARRGVRHEAVLTLGAPLWQILDGDERLALLGHELGHQVNGDATQGVLVTTARRSLHEWCLLFYPSTGPGPRIVGGAAGLAQLLLPVILFPFYLLMTGLQRFSSWLQVHVALRAEFLADDIAAQTASTSSALALIRKLDARGSVEAYVTRVRFGARTARNAPTDEDAMEMWIGLQDYIQTIPEHEYVRAARSRSIAGRRSTPRIPRTTSAPGCSRAGRPAPRRWRSPRTNGWASMWNSHRTSRKSAGHAPLKVPHANAPSDPAAPRRAARRRTDVATRRDGRAVPHPRTERTAGGPSAAAS